MNCARSDHPGSGRKGEEILGHMQVTIPEVVPCRPAHCMLQWVWIGTHISAMNPEPYEYYDNCADLHIVGAQERMVHADLPADKTRKEQCLTLATPPAPDGPSATAGQRDIVTGQGYVRHMLTHAMSHGGEGNDEAILTIRRQIEALEVQRYLTPTGSSSARANNALGITYLRDGKVAEAISATWRFFQHLAAKGEDVEFREIARQTLHLQLVQAAKK